MYNKIITRYITYQIALIFIAITAIIMFIMVGDIFTSVLKNSVEQNLSLSSILTLVFTKIIRDFPAVIALGLTLATTIVINKLYKNSEIYPIIGTGKGEVQLFRSLLPFTIFISVIIASISLIIAPYARTLEQQILTSSAINNDFSFIQTQSFQKLNHGNIVVYSDQDNHNQEKTLGQSFIYNKNTDSVILTDGIKRKQDKGNQVYAVLNNGVYYQHLQSNTPSILLFDRFDLQVLQNNTPNIALATHSKPTLALFASNDIHDIAELQWRLALPIGVFILMFAAIILAKTRPRAKRNFSTLFALLFFVLYINLLKNAKSLVANAELQSYTGTYAVHITIVIVVVSIWLIKRRS